MTGLLDSDRSDFRVMKVSRVSTLILSEMVDQKVLHPEGIRMVLHCFTDLPDLSDVYRLYTNVVHFTEESSLRRI